MTRSLIIPGFGVQCWAEIDPTGVYRYRLTRSWNETLPRLLYIMQNPSKADSDADDPTTRACIRFARKFGYGSFEIQNLFAFRTPYPSELAKAAEPVGELTDRRLREAIAAHSTIVAAWGHLTTKRTRKRAEDVRVLLGPPATVYTFGWTSTNAKGVHPQPRHPLMLSKSTALQRWASVAEPGDIHA